VNHYNRNTNINRAGGSWNHNPAHRGGAPYADRTTANRYGGTARGDAPRAQPANRSGAGTTGANRASPSSSSLGTSNRSGAGTSAGTGDRVGDRSVPSSSSRSGSAFGGASSSRPTSSAARTSSQRGASSVGASRGGGGRR
jgi:hypothetical protein